MSACVLCYICRLPAGERRGYNNALNAMYRIAREEGIGTLWRVCVERRERKRERGQRQRHREGNREMMSSTTCTCRKRDR